MLNLKKAVSCLNLALAIPQNCNYNYGCVSIDLADEEERKEDLEGMLTGVLCMIINTDYAEVLKLSR